MFLGLGSFLILRKFVLRLSRFLLVDVFISVLVVGCVCVCACVCLCVG